MRPWPSPGGRAVRGSALRVRLRRQALQGAVGADGALPLAGTEGATQIQRLLGHSRLAAITIYLHAEPEHLWRVVQGFGPEAQPPKGEALSLPKGEQASAVNGTVAVLAEALAELSGEQRQALVEALGRDLRGQGPLGWETSGSFVYITGGGAKRPRDNPRGQRWRQRSGQEPRPCSRPWAAWPD